MDRDAGSVMSKWKLATREESMELTQEERRKIYEEESENRSGAPAGV